MRAGAGGLRAERGFTACAGVRADGVGAYHFGPLVLDAGEHAEVEAEADAAAWPNVLLEPGEFLPVTGVAEIRNVGPSGGVTAGGLARTFKLEECPEACSRRWFAVSGGRVDLNREAS